MGHTQDAPFIGRAIPRPWTGVNPAASARAKLEHVWRQWPDRVAGHEFDPTQDESLRLICRIGGLPDYDTATAQAWRTMLVSAGALIAERTADGVGYRKATVFPPAPTVDDVLAADRERIERLAKRERALVDGEHRARRDAQAALDKPATDARRADFLFLCREAGLDSASLDARIEEAVERVLSRHLNGDREGVTHVAA